ncbi:hypothetical protein [Bacillus solitudinis]|uniref:hypothetical protein n=1 Tax=Bacillus solitudinis TaxID=2014074 RepID=UPI000C248231|nr:hypothetical protein [Bacillus solitudinis]
MDYLLQFLSVTGVVTFLGFLIKIISLLRTTKVERILLTEEQKIIIFISNIFLISLFFTVYTMLLINELVYSYSLKFEEITASLIVLFLVFAFFFGGSYYMLITLIKKKYAYKVDNMYIIKSINKSTVLLCNYHDINTLENDAYYQYYPKEKLLEMKIIRENLKSQKTKKRGLLH